jgi:hypothetical protein
MSISVKLMGVPGPKLMDEEKFTLDMTGVSTPTFVTPDVRANAQLQIESVKNAQIFYFVNLRDPHILDLIMQSLFIKTQSSPFEAPYFSCALPAREGPGHAVPFGRRRAAHPRSRACAAAPRLLAGRHGKSPGPATGLDFRVQLNDSFLMPMRQCGAVAGKLSPRVSVATFASPGSNSARQRNWISKRLSYNPWHCIARHRPLGNQGRCQRNGRCRIQA